MSVRCVEEEVARKPIAVPGLLHFAKIVRLVDIRRRPARINEEQAEDQEYFRNRLSPAAAKDRCFQGVLDGAEVSGRLGQGTGRGRGGSGLILAQYTRCASACNAGEIAPILPTAWHGHPGRASCSLVVATAITAKM